MCQSSSHLILTTSSGVISTFRRKSCGSKIIICIRSRRWQVTKSWEFTGSLTLEGGASLPRAGPKWPSPEAAAPRSWRRSLRLLNFRLGRCVLHPLGASVDGGGRHSGHGDPVEKESSVRSRPNRVLTGVQVSHGTRAGANSRGWP